MEFDILPNIRQPDSVAATNQLRILISNSIFTTIAVQNQIRNKKNHLNIVKEENEKKIQIFLFLVRFKVSFFLLKE